MSEEGSKRSKGFKLLAASGTGFLLSVGLCGAGASISRADFLVSTGVIVLIVSIFLFFAALISLFADR